jgi:tetratricopeptide (TPR) repeat protein
MWALHAGTDAPQLQEELRAALALRDAGDIAGAERALVDLVGRYPDSAAVRLEIGRLFLTTRRHEQALPHLEAAARDEPRAFDARSLYGQALALAERLPEAEREFRAALELRPADPLVRFNLGRLYRLQGRYAEALPELEKALQSVSDPVRLPGIHLNLATVLQALHRPSQAEPHFEAYLKARPDQQDVRMQLATLQFDLSRYDAALLNVNGVLASEPRRTDALYLRGMLCKIQGRNGEAIDAFRTALEAEPGFHRARYQMATVLHDEGRLPEAEQALRAVVAAEPSHPNAHYLLSQVLRRLKRDAEAEEELAIHNRLAEQDRARGRTVVAGPE